MLDLEAMRATKRHPDKKTQVKTFLTAKAKERLEMASQFVGCAQHELVEELIMTQLPKLRAAKTARTP